MSISGEWLNKLWNMQMIKYSPAIKKKKMFKLYLQGYRSDTQECEHMGLYEQQVCYAVATYVKYGEGKE